MTSEIALAIVEEFGKLSFNASHWETLVGKRDFAPHGCLLDALGINFPENRRGELSFMASRALDLAFPQFTRSKRNWQTKNWGIGDYKRVIEVVTESCLQCLAQGRTSGDSSDSRDEIVLIATTRDSFVPWHLFRRSPGGVGSSGVYLFAIYADEPPETVNPLAREVIYIGVAKEDGTISDRLAAFRRTALAAR